VVALNIDLTFTAWISPILLGLVLSAPVSVWTSRVRYGLKLAKHGILSIPEERNPTSVMLLAQEARGATDPALDASGEYRYGIIAAVVDPYVNGVHVSLLENFELRQNEEVLAEKCLIQGPGALSKDELSELLYLGPAMLLMHRAVWLRPADSIHPIWTQAVQSYRRRLYQTTDAA
jgi:membrane glycosyltransferase